MNIRICKICGVFFVVASVILVTGGSFSFTQLLSDSSCNSILFFLFMSLFHSFFSAVFSLYLWMLLVFESEILSHRHPQINFSIAFSVLRYSAKDSMVYRHVVCLVHCRRVCCQLCQFSSSPLAYLVGVLTIFFHRDLQAAFLLPSLMDFAVVIWTLHLSGVLPISLDHFTLTIITNLSSRLVSKNIS